MATQTDITPTVSAQIMVDGVAIDLAKVHCVKDGNDLVIFGNTDKHPGSSWDTTGQTVDTAKDRHTILRTDATTAAAIAAAIVYLFNR